MAGVGIGAFAGGLASGLGQGQQFQLNRLKIQDEGTQRQGMQALGKTIQGFIQGPAGLPGGGNMPPMPGQPSQPMQQPGAPPQQGAPQGGPQATFPQNQGVVGQLPWMQQQGPPGVTPRDPGVQPPPGAPAGGPPGTSPQGGAPGMPPPGPQGPGPTQQGGQGGGQFTWQQLARQVAQANPGAKPEVIAAAVLQAMPLMTAQSQAEYRQMLLQDRGRGLDIQQQRADQSGDYQQQQGGRADARLDLANRKFEEVKKNKEDGFILAQQKFSEAKTMDAKKLVLSQYRAQLAKRNADLYAAVRAGGGIPDPELQKKLEQSQQDDEHVLKQMEQAIAGGGDSVGGAPKPITPPVQNGAVAPGDFSNADQPAPAGGTDPSQAGKTLTPDQMTQFKKMAAQNPGKVGAAIAHLREQGFDTSGLQ